MNTTKLSGLSVAVAAAALTVSSAQAGYGYGHQGHQGHYHNHYTPVYQPVIVKKVFVPVVPVYPNYNYKICH